MEKQGLSGGAKAGYFALGFFLALIGILITWLVNKDKSQGEKSDAIKFSVIGFVVELALTIISTLVLLPMLATSMSSLY